MDKGKYIVATARNSFQVMVRNILGPCGYVFLGTCNDSASLARMARSYRPDFIITDTSLNPGHLRVVMEAIDDEMLCACIIIGEHADPGIEGLIDTTNTVFFCNRPLNRDILINTVDMAVASFKKVSRIERKLREVTASYNGKVAVDRAKALLMKKYGIDEKEAYARIRNRSMDMRMPMNKVAKDIIEAEDMKRR